MRDGDRGAGCRCRAAGRRRPRRRSPRVRPRPAAASASPSTAAPPAIVAVTACATGIAHTFMAADALTAAGQEGRRRPRSSNRRARAATRRSRRDVIDGADAVIFATDVDVREPQRFAGKPVVRSGVKRGIEQPRPAHRRGGRRRGRPERDPRRRRRPPRRPRRARRRSWGARIQRILLTGVSYMIPFVAGGGLLIALGFLFFGGRLHRAGRTRPRSIVNELAVGPARGGGLGDLPGLGRLRDRRRVDGLPGPGAGGLHRLRDRRPAGHRPGLRRRSDRGALAERRASSAASWAVCSRVSPRGGSARGAVPALAARAHARRDHPAAGLRSSPPGLHGALPRPSDRRH